METTPSAVVPHTAPTATPPDAALRADLTQAFVAISWALILTEWTRWIWPSTRWPGAVITSLIAVGVIIRIARRHSRRVIAQR